MITNTTKVLSHVRSNSFPSTSNNDLLNSCIVNAVFKHSTLLDGHYCSLASSICQKLCDIKSLYQGLENSIQCPFNQQALSFEQHRVVVEEILEGSLNLLDVCAFINDVLSSMKESILELESCLRRKHDYKQDIHAYLMSRKKIHKRVSKYLKNNNLLTTFSYEKSVTNIDVVRMLREAEVLSLATLKCVLGYVSKSQCKRSGWSLMAKMKNSKQEDVEDVNNELEKIDHILHGLESKKINIDVKMTQELSKQLASQELAIFEFEECLESISRCLLKTRVSLLNILSH